MWTLLTSRIAATTAISILLAAGVWYAHNSGVRSGTASTQALWNIERLASHTARADLEATNRKIEKELNDAQQTHSQEVATLRADLYAGRAAAGVAAVRLRDAARATAERAGAQCAAATTAELRASAGDAIGVLAHVFERADERAGVLGAIAEERGIAGRACERAYDSAREALSR
jgi:hypothetical protein